MLEKIAPSFKPTISSSKLYRHLTTNPIRRVKLLSQIYPFNCIEFVKTRRRPSFKPNWPHEVSILRIAPDLVKKSINIDRNSCSFDDSMSMHNIRHALYERLSSCETNHTGESNINKRPLFVLKAPMNSNIETKLTVNDQIVKSESVPTQVTRKLDPEMIKKLLTLMNMKDESNEKSSLPTRESKLTDRKQFPVKAVDENGFPVYLSESHASQLYDNFFIDSEQILARQIVAQRAHILQELVLKKINETNKDGLTFNYNKAVKTTTYENFILSGVVDAIDEKNKTILEIKTRNGYEFYRNKNKSTVRRQEKLQIMTYMNILKCERCLFVENGTDGSDKRIMLEYDHDYFMKEIFKPLNDFVSFARDLDHEQFENYFLQGTVF